MGDRIEKSEEQWREDLGPERYRVMRERGTERPFSGALWDNKASGSYRCAACGEPLFSSETKYESGSGWPSFCAPLEDDRVATRRDNSHGTIRTEALCGRCGSHLGHVFPDGPRPTGLRYCINSLSLEFDPSEGGDDPDAAVDARQDQDGEA